MSASRVYRQWAVVAATAVLWTSQTSEAAFSGFLGMTNGYFVDKGTAKPWVAHGVAYQTWNRPLGVWQTWDQITYDLDQILVMGGNSIRVDFVWQHVEEQGDNIFNWANYDYLVQECDKRNIRIFALIGYQWPPNWFPDSWYTMHPPETDSEGIYHSNRWQSDIIGYETPGARAQYGEWISNVCARYKDSKAIAGWVVGNESGYLGLWSGLLDGYDTNCEAAFRAWCSTKYSGSISNVNAAWGTTYTNLTDIKFVDQYRAYGVEGAIWADMVTWREDSIAGFTAVGAKAAKSSDTNHLISYSTVGMQWGEEDWRYHAEDRGRITAACLATNAPIDFFSVNNYPWAILGHESQNGQWGISFTKKVAKVPVMYSETGFTSSESMYPGLNIWREGPLVRNALWESLEAGAIGTHVFSWMDRPWITDREKGFGILYGDRRIKPAFWTCRDTYNLMDQIKIQDLLAGSQDPTPDIAFLWTDAVDSQHNRYECEMQQIAGALERLGYEPNFINLAELGSGAYTNYKVIILPRNMRVEEVVPNSTNTTVLDFLRTSVISKGVHVLASADLPGIQNFYGKARTNSVNELRSLFGIDASDIGGFEAPMKRRNFVSSYWQGLTVTFTSNAVGSLVNGYTYKPFVWKYSDEITLSTGGVLWASMNSGRNKGFECSPTSIAPWSGWASTNASVTSVLSVVSGAGTYDGSNMLAMAGDAGIWADAGIVPFGRYTANTYLMSPTNNPLKNGSVASLAIEWYAESNRYLGATEAALLSTSTPSGAWVKYSVDAISPSNAYTMRRVIRVRATNLLSNPELTGSGTQPNNWLNWNDPNHDPNYLAYLGLSGNSWTFWYDGGIYQDITNGFSVGDTISYGGWLSTPSSDPLTGTKYGVIQLEFYNNGTNLLSQLSASPTVGWGATLDAWNNATGTATVPTNTTSIRLVVRCNNYGGGNGRFNADDVFVRNQSRSGGVVYVDNLQVNPAVVVKNHGAGKAAIFLYAAGDQAPDGNNDGQMDVIPWRTRYEVIGGIVRDYFGVKPRIWAEGTNAYLCLPEYRTCTNGAILMQIKNYLYDTNFPASWTNPAAGGGPQSFTICSDLLTGKTIRAFEQGRVLEENSDGKFGLTLAPDGQEIVYAFGSGTATVPAGVTSDGQMFRGANERTGVMSGSPQSFPLQSRWTNMSYYAQTPIVGGNRLFVTLGAWASSSMLCIDPATGTNCWQYALPGGEVFNQRSIAYANGLVYATTKNQWVGPLGAVYAFDATTGQLVWKHTGASFNATPPCIRDGMLYFSQALDGFGNGKLRAVYADTGLTKWESTNAVGSCHYAGITVASGKVFVVSSTMFCFNATNGAQLWTANGRYFYAESTPAVWDNKLYVPFNHMEGLGVYDINTGSNRWAYMGFNLNKFASPAIAGGNLYIVGSDVGTTNYYLYCFNATASNTPTWKFPLPGTYADASPIVSSNIVYLNGDKFRAINATTGAELWNFTPASPAYYDVYDPFVANRWAFFCDGYYAYAFSDGTAWPTSAPTIFKTNELVQIKDAPATVHPMGDKSYTVLLKYDCQNRLDLKLKLAFKEVGDNGDGVTNEIYQMIATNVVSYGDQLFWIWIPDPNQKDTDYKSSAEGGNYEFAAWLEDTGGVKVAQALSFPTKLEWGIKPTNTVPLGLTNGTSVILPIKWEDLYEQQYWEVTPLGRETSFPSRIAIFRSSKTQALYTDHFARVNAIADWLNTMGYTNGNSLDLSFDNVTVTNTAAGAITNTFDAGTSPGWVRAAGCGNWTIDPPNGLTNLALHAWRIGNSDNIMVYTNAAYTNFILSSDIRYNVQDKYFNDAEIYFRYVDRDNFCKVGIRNFYGFWRLKFTVRKSTNFFQQGWLMDFPKTNQPATGVWYNVKVDVHGNTNDVYFNNQYVSTFWDTNFPSGKIGVGSSATQLGIWEPQKGYFFIDDDEYSFWAPEGQPQVSGKPLNLDWGYLAGYYSTLILPSVYVMSDIEVSNITIWITNGMNNLIATDGGIAKQNPSGANAQGRIESLFGVATFVTNAAVDRIFIGTNDHYVTMDYAPYSTLTATGSATCWALTTAANALGTITNGGSRPALLCNTLTNNPAAPVKVFCFNMPADTQGQLTNQLKLVAKRAFEWARGEAFKAHLELKYTVNPTNPNADLVVLTTNLWVLTGSGTNSITVNVPQEGIMTGTNLYWVLTMYPWDATNAWTSHMGFFSSGNESNYVTIQGLGVQILGVTDHAYGGRDWDFWIAYNLQTQTVDLVYGLKEKATFSSEDNFDDGDTNGWAVAPNTNILWSVTNGALRATVVSTGGYSYIYRQGLSLTGQNVTVDCMMYFSTNAHQGGLTYRGRVLYVNPDLCGWADNSPNFYTNKTGVTTGKWQHIVVNIRDGVPYKMSDLYVDGAQVFLTEPIDSTNWSTNTVGFLSPYDRGYVQWDAFRVADEQYSFAVTNSLTGQYVPTSTNPAFWATAPDYDPDWLEYDATSTGAKYQWYLYLRGQSNHAFKEVALYFSPRLQVEQSTFPSNLAAGMTYNLPVEWDSLDKVPQKMGMYLQDADTGSRYVESNVWIATASGNGVCPITIPATVPPGSNLAWVAYIYPTNAPDPQGWRSGRDDTYRFDRLGRGIKPETVIRMNNTGGCYIVYSDLGLPMGCDSYTWGLSLYYNPPQFDGLFVTSSVPEGAKCWRTMASYGYAGWGVTYLRYTVDLTRFSTGAMRVWVRAWDGLKLEVEAPQGTKRTVATRDGFWSPADAGTWKEMVIPISRFGITSTNIQQVYAPFEATMVLPNYYAMSFVSSNIGWVVGYAETSYGNIRKTTNGGLTWSYQQAGSNFSSATFMDADFVDANTGWAVGSMGIMKTLDGGSTWATQNIRSAYGYNSWLYGVDFVNANAGYACGPLAVLKTADGGATWSKVYNYNAVTNQFQPSSICFVNTNVGWACGTLYGASYSGMVIKTSDGGTTWTTQYMSNAHGALNCVKFIDANNGWVCGQGSYVFKTANGGTSWTAIDPTGMGAQNFTAMNWLNPSTGWVVATGSSWPFGPYGYIYYTADGGTTWSWVTSLHDVRDLYASGTNQILACGENGEFWRVNATNGWDDINSDVRQFYIDYVRWDLNGGGTGGPPPNMAPTVNAGIDQSLTMPTNTANLAGVVTDDGLPGTGVTMWWDTMSGPAAATFGNPNTTNTTATFPLAGTYVLRLTASDGALNSYDEMTVVVNPANSSSTNPVPLVINASDVIGTISWAGEEDWYSFSITSAGTYTIDTQAGSLTDNVLYLYGPNSTSSLYAVDYDSGDGNMARIVSSLSTGTYLMKAFAYSGGATGTYSVQVASGQPPYVNWMIINYYDNSTPVRTVTLTNSCSGTPLYYMASESATFTGGTWQTYSAAPTYTLSTGGGIKTVYFKVKNANWESPAVSDTIQYSPPVALTVGAGAVTGNLTIAYQEDWYTFVAPATGAYTLVGSALTLPDQCYMTVYGPSNYTTYAGSGLTQAVYSVNATGTYYVKLSAWGGTAVGTYTIRALSGQPPYVQWMTINNWSASTPGTNVTLNNLCSGNPTQYIASESASFTGATWQAYTANAAFNLSTGSANKTVYFKVRNAYWESPVVNDTIQYTSPVPLTVNAGAVTGTLAIANQENWYTVAISVTGMYTLVGSAVTLTDMCYMTVYGPNNYTNYAGSGLTQAVCSITATGTYYVKLSAWTGVATGTYSIAALAGQPPYVSWFTINNWAASTPSTTVSLYNVCGGDPTFYMASEASNFSGGTWLTYAQNGAFNLSTGAATKTVYFKVKNAYWESTPVSDTIQYTPAVPLTVNGGAVTGTLAVANQENWYTFAVSVTGMYTLVGSGVTLTDMCYMTINGPNNYTNYACSGLTNAACTLNATGTYYVKLSAWTGVATGTYSIVVLSGQPPQVQFFQINYYDNSTPIQSVTLTNTCIGVPTSYMASEATNFNGASWLSYSAGPSFNLSTGAGNKTVYFKVKNALGESSPTYDSIIYSPAKALTMNGPGTTGMFAVAYQEDWYTFVAATTGVYTVTVAPGNMTNYALVYLYGPNDYRINIGGWVSQAVYTVASTGTYFVKAVGYDTGTYSVIVRQAQPPQIQQYQINYYDNSTPIQNVTLTNTCIGSPTYYMASESSNFNGASWLSYSAGPSFNLSTGAGNKTVYFKVKNAYWESDPTYDSIIYSPAKALTMNGPGTTGMFAAAYQEDWYTFMAATTGVYTVTVAPGNMTNYALVYLYGPNDCRINIGGWVSQAVYTVASTGTYYVKAVGYATGTYSVIVRQAQPPQIQQYQINYYDNSTPIQNVTLTNTCIGSPTYYMASESSNFNGASWLSYSAGPSFNLSTGAGNKTVYFKVKNAYWESDPAYDSIAYSPPVALTVNGSSVTGTVSVSGQENWYTFQAPATGVYTVNTARLSLPVDAYVYLYGPNDYRISVGGWVSQAVYTVSSTGTYYTKVFAYSTGTYWVAASK